MLVTVRYTPEVKTPFDQAFFVVVAEEVLARCPILALKGKEVISLDAISVSSEKIQELNRTYLGKDTVTDILSFGEYPDTVALESDTKKNIVLGEIFFCQEFIKKSAAEDGVTFEHEMIYVFSHGILHLLGYNHSDEMFALQDQVTESLIQDRNTRKK